MYTDYNQYQILTDRLNPSVSKKMRQYRNQVALELNIDSHIKKIPPEKLLFGTITLKKDLKIWSQKDQQEASKRVKRFLQRAMKPYIKSYVRVIEPQVSGRIHYHLIIETKDPWRKENEKFEWEKYTEQRNSSNFTQRLQSEYWEGYPSALQKIWSRVNNYIRNVETIGLTEFVPIKSITSASKYLSEYLCKEESLRINYKMRRTQYSAGYNRPNTAKFTSLRSRYRDAIKSACKTEFNAESDFSASQKTGWSIRQIERYLQKKIGFFQNLVDKDMQTEYYMENDPGNNEPERENANE